MERVKMTERLPADVRTPERHLFTLRVDPTGKRISPMFEVRAYDSYHKSVPHGHNYISLELFVREDDRECRVFSFDRWCGLPRGEMIDGTYAKREALESVAMKPGDTDDEFFAEYPQELLDIVIKYGDAIDMVASERYGEG